MADDKAGQKPRVAYRHLWTDADDLSHQKHCELASFTLKGVGGDDPQWNNEQSTAPSTVVVTVRPVGWVGDWPENPAPQWIVVLSGPAMPMTLQLHAEPKHEPGHIN